MPDQVLVAPHPARCCYSSKGALPGQKGGAFFCFEGEICQMNESRQPSHDFGSSLLEILEAIPALEAPDNRDQLLHGLPPRPVGAIRRSSAWITDLGNIVTAVERWGQLESGEWPLVVIVRNALRFSEGTQRGEKLEELLAGFDRPIATTLSSIQGESRRTRFTSSIRSQEKQEEQVQTDTRLIRKSLNDTFDDSELTNFCYDHFRLVHDKFSQGMQRSQKIQLLIEYCERHGKIGDLLSKIYEVNPYQYNKVFGNFTQKDQID